MRVWRILALLIAVVAVAAAQVQLAPAGSSESLQSIFGSGLAASLLSADTPTVSGVRSGSDFGNLDTFAAGSWIEIKGATLSDTTRTWAGSDFNGQNAPTVIDNIRVTVDNVPAFVFYVSPTQVNVQVPNSPSTTGPVDIRVTNPSGGMTFTGQKRPRAAGMLAPPSFNVGGRQYMAAQFAAAQDRGFFVGRENLIQGAAFRPARARELITAYGIGFGEVSPAIAPGVVPSGLHQLPAGTVTIAFGQTPATVSFAGLAPGFLGLYQFNIEVPAVAAGDHQINITVGGQPLQQPAMYLTVGQ